MSHNLNYNEQNGQTKMGIKFSIQSLFSEKDGKISGPMSPAMFAQEMAALTEFKFNRLARVRFDDERINQNYEDGGLTGHDSLIIGQVCKNDVWLSLWVDKGVYGVPVAMCFQSKGEITFTPAYQKQKFAAKLDLQDIKEIFDFIFQNLDQIAIKKD